MNDFEAILAGIERSNDQIFERIESVHDEQSFIAFLKALSDNWEMAQSAGNIRPSPPYGPDHAGWENGTIGSFLEAASRFGEAWLALERSSDNPWKRAAKIIHAGKYYE